MHTKGKIIYVVIYIFGACTLYKTRNKVKIKEKEAKLNRGCSCKFYDWTNKNCADAARLELKEIRGPIKINCTFFQIWKSHVKYCSKYYMTDVSASHYFGAFL